MLAIFFGRGFVDSMPPPDGIVPAEGSQQQAHGPQTPPQLSPSESYMRDATVPIPEERPLLRENLSAPAGFPQPVAPRSPLSQPQVPESPVSVVLVQPQHPAAPLGEPLHPHEDLNASADEKVCCTLSGSSIKLSAFRMHYRAKAGSFA